MLRAGFETPELARTAASSSIVYVIGTYPLLTTTFIDREIRGLRQRGIAIRVVAVRRPPDDTPLSAEQRLATRSVAYLLPARAHSVAAAHGRTFLRSPLAYLSTLAWLVSRPHPGFRARVKSLMHFGEGVVVADLTRTWSFREFHAHFIDRAATIAMVAARLRGTTYSLSVHAGADLYVDPILVPEKVNVARRVITCTEHNRERLIALGGARSRIEVAYHGIDVPRAGPHLVASEPPVILGVGQLTERKGFRTLIESCAILRDRGRSFVCTIVGRGPDEGALTASIAALGLDGCVTLVGALPHDDVVERYRRATVLALPCVRRADGDVDGIPNVLAEAMAMGLPVVASDLPAIGELVRDRVEGFLPPSGDAASLADALDVVLLDPVLGREMGERGRRTVREVFDLERNIGRFEELLWPSSGGPPGGARLLTESPSREKG
jgi:glycosyltransferase involved in cell wall biosynthesis